MAKGNSDDSSQFHFIRQPPCVMDCQLNIWLENHSIFLHRFYATLNIKLKKKSLLLLLAATVHKRVLHLQANDMCPAHYCCSQQFQSRPWLLLITCRCIFSAPACWLQLGRYHFERTKWRWNWHLRLALHSSTGGRLTNPQAAPDCSCLESQFALAVPRSDWMRPLTGLAKKPNKNISFKWDLTQTLSCSVSNRKHETKHQKQILFCSH